MLVKLMKHDTVSIGKLLLPLNGIVLLMGLIGAVSHFIGFFELENVGPLVGALSSTYVIGLAVIMVVSYFYPIIHFYRNLFSTQGYLTFTLPVCSWKILFSKTIASFGWYLVNIVVALFSLWAVTGFYRLPSGHIVVINAYLIEEIGMGFATFMGWMFGITFFSLLWSLLTAFFSICVGQLFAKHKIIASVGAYIVIYTLVQILVTAMFIPFIFSAPGIHTVVIVSFYSTILFSVVFSVLFYLGSGMILKKKVNLD